MHTRSRRLVLGLTCAIATALALPAYAQLQDTPAAAQTSTTGPQALCQPQVVGNRRIPRDSVIARMASHQGDAYDQATVERDFNSLWNTGYFQSLRIERVDTPTCVQLVVYVTEKPTVRTIEYVGLNAVTQSDVQERFKKAKVGLTVESQFDFTKVKRAETVLKDLLAEHGHQFATIRTEIKTIPPQSVGITFRIKEGPTVKVGHIVFDGNYNVSDRTLRNSMRNLRPIGIPHSIILENLFARTFDASKLDEDTERVRIAYLDRGYMNASTGEPKTQVRDKGGLNWFTLRPSNGKRMDITIPIDEGERYRLAGITFSGYKLLNNTKAFRAQFPMKDGDWFNATELHKGMENLRKAYGSQGYINMVANPIPKRDDKNHTVTFNIEIDEGKQFYVSRIEFTGNTITRDKVIRRELVLEEGQVYNSQLWDLSILRLNQLGYFENLKVEDDTETHQDPETGTVDLLLRLKEKGKNSIGLNGGLSGLQGTFIGLNYETNNFLGLGETLSVNANVGDRQRNLSFGFNEPYLRNKPLSIGFEAFTRKMDYNPAKAYSVANGVSSNISEAAQSLLTNYNESTTGFTVSASQPLKHLWAGRGVTRVGVTYALSRATVTTFNDNTRNVFQSLAFRSGVAGPSQLNGIITSTIAPSFSYSSLDRPVGAHSGRDFNVTMQIAGAGGNVKYIAPVGTFRQYLPMKGLKINREGHNVLGIRAQMAFISGFGGQVAPPTNRLYGGGESDIRGFDVRAASPYTFIPVSVPFDLTNPDGSTIPRDPTNPALGTVKIPMPIYRPVAIGGDTQFTGNIQYQIPIVSSLSFNFFSDFGLTGDLRPSQLRQSVAGADLLSSPLYGCPTIVNGACFGGKQISTFSPIQLNTMPGTNFVPRMSVGAELQVVLPIVNAPFRIFYAYNPLRLYKDVPQQLAVDNNTFRSLFPNNDAGLFSYREALALYGPSYQLREPRKTFRLTVGTTF
ncbi:MAG TPA: outer membrane protein assembly factor BamA [Acidobacteriaceae bacterium]|nr:outer membrane protein assembly factor BamA [Acidobacteriaceae bacterium]